MFGAASTITPFLLGASLGAVSSGAIRVIGSAVSVAPLQAWLNPLTMAMGATALALSAYLAAVYLTVETQGQLQEDFRRRALLTGGLLALLAVVLLPLLARYARHSWEVLWQWQTLPLFLGGVLLAVGSAWGLFARRYKLSRICAVGEVSILLWGWALAHWPYLIYPDLTLLNAAAPLATLNGVLLTVLVGLVLLIPSLWLLFRVFKGGREYKSRP